MSEVFDAYLLEEETDYEGCEVLGVYANLTSAQIDFDQWTCNSASRSVYLYQIPMLSSAQGGNLRGYGADWKQLAYKRGGK